MTKHVRIENADTSDHKVRVYVERKHPTTGQWSRDDGVLPDRLDHPAAMLTGMIHSHQRLVIEEWGGS